jgi:hypothetical protein
VRRRASGLPDAPVPVGRPDLAHGHLCRSDQLLQRCVAQGDSAGGTGILSDTATVTAIVCAGTTMGNALFAAGTAINQTSGICLPGYAGTYTSTCVYNDGTGLATWSAPVGIGCARTLGRRLQRWPHALTWFLHF